RDAAARHPEPAPPLRARRGRSPADVTPAESACSSSWPGLSRPSTSWGRRRPGSRLSVLENSAPGMRRAFCKGVDGRAKPGHDAARGIALAANKPVVGITTLTAYAAPHVSEHGEHPIISAIDARHDHVYLQVASGHGGPLVTPRVAPIEEALAASRFGAPLL